MSGVDEGKREGECGVLEGLGVGSGIIKIWCFYLVAYL